MKTLPITKFIAVVAIGILLSACQGIPTKTGGGGVSIIDAKTQAHEQAELTMADYLVLSENVTNKMLSSKLVQKWKERPRLIVGNLLNNTDNENIRMRDLHDRIQETIFNAGIVRIVDKTATDFEYVIKSELTSTRQYGKEGRELVHYTLQLKMFTLMGELMGQWSDDLAMAKSERSLF